jgi:hypothetical protein
MDNQEAKFILKAYRPGGADASDPMFAEALAQAERDPQLRAWMEREQQLDRVVAEKLRGVPVPAGLRETILTGARVSRAPARTWWQQPWPAAAAAAVAIAAGVALWQVRLLTAPWKEFAAVAINDLRVGQHGGHGAEQGRLQAALGEPGWRLSAGLPVEFGRLKADGCRTFKVAGREVLEICFVREGREFHLYVMRRDDAGWADQVQEPRFADEAGLSSMVWTDARHVYALVGEGGRAALKALL